MPDPYDNKERKNDSDPKRPGSGSPPPARMNRGVFSWFILIALAVISFVLLTQNQNGAEEKTSGELLNYIDQGVVESITVGDGQFRAKIKEGAANPPKNNHVYVNANVGDEWLHEQIMEKDPLLIKEKEMGGLLTMILINALPVLLIFGLLWFFIFRGLRNGGGGGGMLGNFGRSRHKVISKEMTEVSLEDVAGVEEAKDEVGEIIKFLKNPKKFQRLGGRIPRGVLLIGSPGCGKTLLAKAVAGEAEVPFFSISGSDFVEMFVGVGASRVRDLFKQAKESSPCIIFLDEIDAVGRRRGSGVSGGGGHDEREQTLNAILVEMDGFESNDQVIVIAATNRSDVLDPALTRPGRFDRQITVHLPDVKGRYEILQVHAAKIKLSEEADLEKLARGTPMFSGADLAAIINESAIIATLADKDAVEQEDLEEARDKVKFGRASKSRKIDEDERIGTAYHEAGHAVIQHLLPDADPLHKVTIIPRGQAMGATMSLPEKDRYGYGQRYIHATLRVLCGGRIAEQRKTDDITSGASMDIRMATNYARHMILEWGMSDKLGFIDYATPMEPESPVPEKAYSDETALLIDQEVKRLTDEAYAEAKTILDENWEKVVAVSEALLKYETLNADEVGQLMDGKTLDKPTISEMIDTPPSASSSSKKAEDKPEADKLGEGGAVPSPA